jgi:hypothetical protein
MLNRKLPVLRWQMWINTRFARATATLLPFYSFTLLPINPNANLNPNYFHCYFYYPVNFILLLSYHTILNNNKQAFQKITKDYKEKRVT